MSLSNKWLREMVESPNPGPHLREMAEELLALRTKTARLAWMQDHHADIKFSDSGCSVRGWDGDASIYGFGSDLSAAVDAAMRKTK